MLPKYALLTTLTHKSKLNRNKENVLNPMETSILLQRFKFASLH